MFYPEKLKLCFDKSSPPSETAFISITNCSCIMRSHNFSVAFLYLRGFQKVSSIRLSVQARLAQSVEHETLNLGVVGSSPTLGDTNFDTCSDVLGQHRVGTRRLCVTVTL